MQEWYSVLCGLLATVGLLAFVCLLMSVFIQINESGHKNHTHSPSRIFRDGLDDVLNELEDRCEKENDKMINNLDEATDFCKRKASNYKRMSVDAGTMDLKPEEAIFEEECKRYEQLAEWLTELKTLRNAPTYEEGYNIGYAEGLSEGIELGRQ